MNYFVISASLKAHSEGLFLFLFVLGIMLLIRYFSRASFQLSQALLIAVVGGLCAATKLNGAMIVAFYSLLAIIIGFANARRNKIRAAIHHTLSAVYVPLLSFLAFVIVNPILYLDPINNSWLLIKHRLTISHLQSLYFSNVALDNFSSRVLSVFSKFLDLRQANSLSAPFPGHSSSLAPIVSTLLSLFFIVGLVTFIYQGKNRRDMHARILFSGLFGLTLLMMGTYLRLSWDRYYIPAAPFILFFQGYGIVTVFQQLRLILSIKPHEISSR
jgi:hypothetical protein